MDNEQQVIEAIQAALAELGFGERSVHLRQIPFNGAWGYATTIAMQLANERVSARADDGANGLTKKEARQREQTQTQEVAQDVAERLAERLMRGGGFSRVEAIRGYVNLYLATGAVAEHIVRQILTEAEGYGQRPERTDRIMIEYSQPNTHKSFHVGHLRNAALGSAMVAILRFAGYPVLAANYIGDIGLHVIKTLWCFRGFHQHDVPAANKGRWLGQVYAEAEARLRYREDVLQFIHTLIEAEYCRPTGDRLAKEVLRRGASNIDVAYLLGRIDFLQKLDLRKFREELTPRIFFDVLGPWLRDQIDQERIPEEHFEQWQALHVHVDWWDLAATWEQEIKDTWQAWEQQDPVLLADWQMTRQWSLDDFMATYDELGVEFDVWFYESEVEEPGRVIVQDLLDRGIAEISDNLPVVKIDEQLGLDKEKYRVLPILRSDGTTLYSTKDLALARVKFETYQIDRSLYVVDVRQSLYMQQIFKVLELWGFPQAANCFHLSYEFVAMPDGAMSSRKGNVVVLEDVLDEALMRARAIIDEKNPDLTDGEKENISRQVAIGSLKYYMLSRDRNSVIIFDWEKALSFDGQAAPYIQYAHARACRILERSEAVVTADQARTFTDLMPEEIALTQELSRFGGEIERAAAGYNPLLIVNYVYQAAKIFNDFYHACPVISAPEPQRTARLALVAASRQVLANGLRLLGIDAPTIM